MCLLMVTWLHRRNIAWNPRLSLTRELAVFNSSLSELTVVNSSLAVFNSSLGELAVFNSSPSELAVFDQFTVFYAFYTLSLSPSKMASTEARIILDLLDCGDPNTSLALFQTPWTAEAHPGLVRGQQDPAQSRSQRTPKFAKAHPSSSAVFRT